MPTDVSDLRDVVDAINKLCDTMKTSYDDDDSNLEPDDVKPTETIFRKVEMLVAERWTDADENVPDLETGTSVEEPIVYDVGSEASAEPAVYDLETEAPVGEPTSEMYYTASSEVSLLSTDSQDRGQDSDRERDDRERVMAGHVAAMRERFESMTRTNTPCPDLMRSISPSFEIFRTSPDHDRT